MVTNGFVLLLQSRRHFLLTQSPVKLTFLSYRTNRENWEVILCVSLHPLCPGCVSMASYASIHSLCQAPFSMSIAPSAVSKELRPTTPFPTQFWLSVSRQQQKPARNSV